MTDHATIGRTMLDVSKRLGAWTSIALAVIAAIVALQANQPRLALDHVEAAIPAVEVIVADTDVDPSEALHRDVVHALESAETMRDEAVEAASKLDTEATQEPL